MARRILDFIDKMPYELSYEERKTQIFVFLTFSLIPCFIFSYIWFGLLMKLNYIPFSFSIYSMMVGISFMIYYWDELDAKYKFRSNIFNLSYQFQVLLLIFLISPILFFGMLSLGLTTNNIWFGVGGAVATLYPVVLMFLRVETFSDDSILISEKVILPAINNKRSGVPREALPNINFSREVTETKRGFGYMPLAYWILSVLLGVYITGTGFSDIHWYFVKGSPSLGVAIFTIVLGLVVQSVYLFPDKLNRVVPVELRTKNGYWFMVILSFVLFVVSWFLISVVTALTT